MCYWFTDGLAGGDDALAAAGGVGLAADLAHDPGGNITAGFTGVCLGGAAAGGRGKSPARIAASLRSRSVPESGSALEKRVSPRVRISVRIRPAS
jgi:hypothetical protein